MSWRDAVDRRGNLDRKNGKPCRRQTQQNHNDRNLKRAIRKELPPVEPLEPEDQYAEYRERRDHADAEPGAEGDALRAAVLGGVVEADRFQRENRENAWHCI